MPDTQSFEEFERALGSVEPEPKPGECFCSWLTAEEVSRRNARAASTAESRSEAVRILRLIEAQSGGNQETLLMVAKAWMDLAHIPQ